MAALEDKLYESLGDMAAAWAGRDYSRPANMRELAGALAEAAGRPARAGNRLLAEALGVTPRTVQRWTTETAKQRRAVSPQHAEAAGGVAGSVAMRQVVDRIAEDGLDFELEADVMDPSGHERERRRSAHLAHDSAAVSQLTAALAMGDAQGAAAAFQQGFFAEWGIRSYGSGEEYGGGFAITDVQTLHLS